MSGGNFDRDEEAMKAAVSGALEARDRATPILAFTRTWARATSRPLAGTDWRPAFAAFASLVVLASASWVFLGRHAEDSATEIDLRATALLAREFSSADYWRVPTDDLLAFAAPPLSAELPSPEGFHVSLEESLL